jgi:hypothetical protein
MPKAWSAKDARQYKHVKDSEKQRGRSTDQAEEIAARTVNKQRREEGRTPTKRTQGTGNPNASLDELTRDELYNRAKEMDISGRSRMKKVELVKAVGGANQKRTRAAARAVPRTRRPPGTTSTSTQ